MISNAIIQIINEGLSKFSNNFDAKCYHGNSILKFVFNVNHYFFEITYFYVDDYYRIKMENWKNNAPEDTVFLSKSKQFRKDIRKTLKKLKIQKKSFANHIRGLLFLINKFLLEDGDLKFFYANYDSLDLKFDGIFI